MDKIVNRLGKIETAATAILEATNVRKLEMEQQSADKLKAYDLEISSKTAEKIAKLKATLDEQKDNEIDRIKTETADVILRISHDYENNHEALAKQLFEKMIKG